MRSAMGQREWSPPIAASNTTVGPGPPLHDTRSWWPLTVNVSPELLTVADAPRSLVHPTRPKTSRTRSLCVRTRVLDGQQLGIRGIRRVEVDQVDGGIRQAAT